MANGIVWYFGPDLDSALENPVVMQGKDEAGNVLHEVRFGGVRYGDFPYCFIADPDGRLYVGLHDLYNTYRTPDLHFVVYHQEGYRIDFPDLHGANIFALHRDSSGNIYVGGLNNADDDTYIFRKYNSSGTLQWSKKARTIDDSVQTGVRNIKEDAGGYLYVCAQGLFSELTKYDSSGNHQWTQVVKSESGISGIKFIAIDSSGYIYTAGDNAQGYYQGEAYDPYDWTWNITYFDEATYTGGQHEYYNIIKWDSSGNFIAGAYTGSKTDDFKIVNDYLYILSNAGFHKLSTSFVQQSFTPPSFNLPVYASFSIFDINPDDETVYTANFQRPLGVKFTDQTLMPSLPIPMFLGEPYWQGDRYNIIPSLALNYALKAPSVIRDFAGAFQLPNIYRCYLTGGSGTIELQLASFSCRRGYGVMTISAVCPALTDSQVQQVIDRVAGNLIIKRGIKFANGVEQLDEMLVAPLSESPYRLDTGGRSASMTLDAKSDAEIENPKTRAIQGISYRNSANGSRRIRCSVDTYLRPGDTADLGGEETMIVGEITYAISPTQAFMEISEAS